MSELAAGQVWRHDRKGDTVVVVLLEPHGHRDWNCFVMLDSWRERQPRLNRLDISRLFIDPTKDWRRVT
jgi:hypothetical protein